MKTTIDIPDALAARARKVASEHETTLRALVVAGLEAEVERVSVSAPIDFHFPTVGGHGLAVEVEPTQVIALSYEPLDPDELLEPAAARATAANQ